MNHTYCISLCISILRKSCVSNKENSQGWTNMHDWTKPSCPPSLLFHYPMAVFLDGIIQIIDFYYPDMCLYRHYSWFLSISLAHGCDICHYTHHHTGFQRSGFFLFCQMITNMWIMAWLYKWKTSVLFSSYILLVDITEDLFYAKSYIEAGCFGYRS
jgi:hypothetical protein